MHDLTKIRLVSGAPNESFEELCVHLAEAICQEPLCERLRVHGAGGDGGVEAIAITNSGRRVGIQSKYFLGKLSHPQWDQIWKSIQQAMLNHPELSEYVICVPRNRTPAQIRSWNNLVSKCASHHPDLKVIWVGQTELVQLLAQPQWSYLATFWLGTPEFSRNWLAQKLDQAIAQLHKRFTPQYHNTTRAEEELALMLALPEALRNYKEMCRDLAAGARNLAGMFEDATRSAPGCFTDVRASVDAAVHDLLINIADGRLQEQGVQFSETLKSLVMAAGLAREQEVDAGGLDPEVEREVFERLSSIRKAARVVQSLAKQIAGAFTAHHDALSCSLWLISGTAGIGKSHLMATAAQNLLAQDAAAVMLLGEQFREGRPLRQQIVDLLDWEYPFSDLLACLQAQSETSGKPSLILIDAINESPQRGLWHSHLSQLLQEIKAFPGVHLLLSCRDDWLSDCVPLPLVDDASRLAHHGYDLDLEAAVNAYFQGYNVAADVFPSFTPEFRNPLFLKTVCETYQDRRLPNEPLSFVAVLDAWERRACERIKEAIDCRAHVAMRAIERIIGQMTLNCSASIPAQVAESICLECFPNSTESGSLYRALQSVGVISEVPSTSGPLVRLQYERFYDVKVARLEMQNFEDSETWSRFWIKHVLPHIDRGDVAAASEARLFAYALLLPEMFDLELVECTFPEPDETGYAPSHKIWDIWLEALAWRKIPSAHARVHVHVRHLFEVWQRTGEARISVFHRLMSFAAIEDHPLNADFLHNYLWESELIEREVLWTVPLGYEDLSDEWGELRSFIGWCEAAGTRCSDEQARLAANVLLWLTSSTNQKNRDQATDSTIRLLKGRPGPMSQLVDRFWEVDDPYVKERLLAVVAGIMPTLQRDDLRSVGGEVCARFFGGERVSANLLQREYARFIAEYCIHQDVLPDELQGRVRPPYRTVMPEIWSEHQVRTFEDDPIFRTIRQSLQPDKSGRLYGDFGRYVMQSAVERFTDPATVNPAADRSSERYPREDANAARRYILQRVVELGWPDPHGELDRFERSIQSDGRQRSPMERISKKFQWIGLYEYVGYLSDHRELRNFSDELVDFVGASDFYMRDYDPARAFFPKARGNRRLSTDMGGDTCNPIPAMDAEGDRSEWIASDFEDFTRYLHVKIDGKSRLVLSAHLSFDEPLPFGVSKESVQHAAQWVNLYSFIVPTNQTAALSTWLSQRTFWGNGVALPTAYAGWITEYPWHSRLDDVERECSSGHRWLAEAEGLFHGTVCSIGSEDQPFALPSPGVCREMGKSTLGALSPPQQTATGDFSILAQDRREIFWGTIGGGSTVAASYPEFMEWLREKNWSLVVCVLSERTVEEGSNLLAESHQSAVIVLHPFEAPQQILAQGDDWRKEQSEE